MHSRTLQLLDPDIPEIQFGRQAPAALLRSLIRCAQRCPRNWLGQQIAQVIRHVVLRLVSAPIDVSVGTIRMRCRFSDNCSERKFVFMPWRFDGRERRLLVDALPPDGVFVDIGANVGIYTLTAATHLGSRGRVIALEPSPEAFARLRFNTSATQAGRRDWPRIDLLRIGVADRECAADLHLVPTNLGASSIVPARNPPARDEPGSSVVRIDCRPLLTLLAETGVSRIDALKIDIEGAEDVALMPFLSGAPAGLLPRLLIIENSEARWSHDLPGALARRGFSVVLRTRMNTVHRRNER